MMMARQGNNQAWIGALLAAAGCAGPCLSARPPRIPGDAPLCARPGQPALFLSPMGEPFRAPAGTVYPSAAWAVGADSNRDGVIDRAEIIADAGRFFARLDLNRDGRLTPDEITAYERDVAPEIAIYQNRAPVSGSRQPDQAPVQGGRTLIRTPRLAPGVSDYGGAMGAGRYAWLNVPQPVASADTDMNRAIDAREFGAAASRRLDMLDRAGAGRLRLTDLPVTPAQQAIVGPCHPLPAPRTGPAR